MVNTLTSIVAKSRRLMEFVGFSALVSWSGCTQDDLIAESSLDDSPELGAPVDRPAAPSPDRPTADPPAKKKARPAQAESTTPSGTRAVWIQLKDRADLSVAQRSGNWSQRGRMVHQALADTATRSQASLRSYLEARNIDYRAFWAVNAVKATLDPATIRVVEQRPDVARIVEDRYFTLPPITPGQAAQVRAVEWNIANIRAPEVWSDFGSRGEGIVVATIDTGAQFDHPALASHYRGLGTDGSIDHNYSWHDPSNVCGSPSLAPCDNDGHGTHTTGTIVGDDGGDNQIGVAPAARWISAKGCEGGGCSFEALISSGQWMLAPTDLNGDNPRPDLRPHIVSNSWGGGPGDEFYREIVQAWVAAGIFPVFANGNAGPECGSAGSPGDYPESYAVGAYDEDEFIASFSSRGPSPFGVVKPNISAPGVDVRSSTPGGGYASFSGTSMATPHVAGAIALLWSAAPSLAGDVAATRALFDTTAIDRDDDNDCGGDETNNNSWGEGQLDVYATLSDAPIGPTGHLVGTVTNDAGNPIPGATVSLTGEFARNVVTDAAGAYAARLPIGVYDTNATAFGYVGEAGPTVEILTDETTTLDFGLEAAPVFAVSGTVRNTDGAGVAGVDVSIVGTPIEPTTTDADGRYTFDAVPQGQYTMAANAGGCFAGESRTVDIEDDSTVDFVIAQRTDEYGYVCHEVAFDYVAGDTLLPLFGDDDDIAVDLPFAFPFYGATYEQVRVTTNGFATFTGGFAEYFNTSIPSPAPPNAAIYPLWDDLYVEEGGEVLTASRGTAPNRSFVIEWRAVPFLADFTQTATFSLTLHENGAIDTQYADTSSGRMAKGASATVGIEDATGSVALQYSFNRDVLSDGLAVRYEVPFSGFVQGTVIDGNDELPVASASITATADDGTERHTTTNAAGEYRLQLTEGTYTLVISKAHYSVVTTMIHVQEGVTLEGDVRLDTAKVEVDTPSLSFVLGPDEVRSRKIVVSNRGLLATPFEVRESGGDLQVLRVTRKLERTREITLNARTTKGLYPDKPPGSGITPASPGDVIASFVPDGLELAWGIGEAEHLWLSDAFGLLNYEYTSGGDPTGRVHDTLWAEDFPADMAYDDTRDLVCQLAVGFDNAIHCWDPSTGDVEETIGGAFPWTAISQRGLAYRSEDDSFYVGGWNEGVIYRIAGLSHADPGEVLGSCSPADGDISGLAYNATANTLWVATNSEEDTIYELDASDCTVLSTLAPPQAGGYQGAGLEMDLDGNLWVVAQEPNRVYLIESGAPTFGDIEWLVVDPAAGDLDPFELVNAMVTVDTTGLEPGVYLGTLTIISESGREPSLRIPVSLIVSGYSQAANAGGWEYVDTAGDTWLTDQAYSAGDWGYVQTGKTRKTRKTIAGTDDDPLYQSQRQNAYAYRYDDVPNGIYEIDLRFAELQNVDFGDRLFDVIVEQSLLLPAHDIYYEVGRRVADDHRFFIEVADGRLDVRLVPRAGAKKPVINALRVRHRPDR